MLKYKGRSARDAYNTKRNDTTSQEEWFRTSNIKGDRVKVNKLFYPAIFHIADEGGFWVTFPDISECMTQGDDMTQAYEMAVEALGLAITSRLEEKEVIPVASQPNEINENR